MRRTFHVELVDVITEEERKRRGYGFVLSLDIVITCLRCGYQKRELFGYENRQPFLHTCDDLHKQIVELEDTTYWRTVARDAFLEGREREAIQLIIEEVVASAHAKDAIDEEVPK